MTGDDTTQQITSLLQRYADGDAGAFDELVSALYPDLRRMASRQLNRARFGPTLNTTGLVHEAYMKLVDQDRARWNDRTHFLAIASRAMRQIIVDYARSRFAQKRGAGHQVLQLDEARLNVSIPAAAANLLALNEALEGLEAIDPRMVRVVECRFFTGLTEKETSDALEISVRTVQRTWMRARAWLKHELGSAPPAPPGATL